MVTIQIDPQLQQKYKLVDVTPRYAPEHVWCIGDRGFTGIYPVTRWEMLPAGTALSPRGVKTAIVDDLPVLACTTQQGVRYYGVLGGYINSELRMVVYGINPVDEVRVKWDKVPEDRL